MRTVSNKQLKEISQAIVDAVDPLMVILMGSQAQGTANGDSDIDLLVVGDRPSTGSWSRRRTVGKLHRNLPKINIPVDILFFTPSEILRWRDATNHVIHRALHDGNILYERS